ncbi:DUF456 domain-containing protein [Halonotius terrestris]|uniref:DUF456 domain-containing protein n=1 Tax=Halonotius terrestris TaxID=2487750 RepID=A0A8J8TC21_9EURY|nr:DUF456 domain-containing protein [Halonotius terrestris]TQQ82727.1 DUF456 domain-containing protein [Halonotius terrestris]
MVDLVLVAAVVLMVAAMAGSLLPAVPSGLFSLAGVWVYALFGSDGLGPVALGALTLAAVATVVIDQVGGPIAAKLGGSSNRTVLIAAVVGFVLLFVLGPLGIIVGVVATVIALELADGADIETAARRGVYTAAGVLASSVAQLLLTGSILVAFLLVVFLL